MTNRETGSHLPSPSDAATSSPGRQAPSGERRPHHEQPPICIHLSAPLPVFLPLLPTPCFSFSLPLNSPTLAFFRSSFSSSSPWPPQLCTFCSLCSHAPPLVRCLTGSFSSFRSQLVGIHHLSRKDTPPPTPRQLCFLQARTLLLIITSCLFV